MTLPGRMDAVPRSGHAIQGCNGSGGDKLGSLRPRLPGCCLAVQSLYVKKMGFLEKIFKGKDPGRYQSDEDQAANKKKQISANVQILDVLREHGVTGDTRLRLEFFFYTNTIEKATSLSDALASLGYSTEARTSAHNAKEFLVNGWSIPTKMDESSVLDWSSMMCDLAANHDCEFDGWGTDPTQTQSE